MKLATLAIIRKDNQILLGYKKRGFAEGVLNGPGGKLESSENTVECIIRETREEVGITLKDPKLCGVLEFFDGNEKDWMVFVFRADSFSGEVSETEEIKPVWVSIDDIPYDKMWQDDKLWLPYVLDNKIVHGTFYFNKGSIEKNNVRIIE